jgi:hypothetical protein
MDHAHNHSHTHPGDVPAAGADGQDTALENGSAPIGFLAEARRRAVLPAAPARPVAHDTVLHVVAAVE